MMTLPWKILRCCSLLGLAALASHHGAAFAQKAAAASAPANDATPRIVILTTGGTIAGKSDERSEVGYNSAQLDPNQLILTVPGINTLARVSSERIASIGSQDMSDSVWLALAARITELFAQNAVDGVVVTHGTDTMEETAFFLDLVLARGKPVVLVGAMRPSSATSADGPANLFDAVKVAASPSARDRGVLVVMNGTIHSARDVEKTHTTALETFRSPNFGPVGYVNAAAVRFSVPSPPPRSQRYSPGSSPPLPRVDIIYAHSNMDGAIIEEAAQRGARGLVLAGVGDGNCSKSAIDALGRAAARGIVVVRASRTGAGFVDRNVEIDDDKLGFVAALDLNPQKARVLTQLLIASHITDAAAVQLAFAQR
jgi:L-asparaginase